MEALEGRKGPHRDRPVWSCAGCVDRSVDRSGAAPGSPRPPLEPVRKPNSGYQTERRRVSGARKTDSKGLRSPVPGGEAGAPPQPGAGARAGTGPDTSLPVEWWAKAPSGFLVEFAAVAALPEFVIPEKDRQRAKALRRALHGDSLLDPGRSATSACVLFSADRGRTGSDPDSYAAGLLLTKILQRGHAPMPTLGVEREAVRVHNLQSAVVDREEDVPEGGELGWRPRNGGSSCLAPELAPRVLAERREFILDPEFEAVTDDSLFDSPLEHWFLAEWVPEHLGPEAGHWFTPQAPLDTILDAASGRRAASSRTRDADGSGAGSTATLSESESSRGSGAGARRLDFLFHHPGGAPLAIELDGPEHEAAAQVDRGRDRALRNAGIETVRVGVAELEAGEGSELQRIRRHCEQAFEALPSSAKGAEPIVAAAADCVAAARVQFALARSLQYGWLQGGGEWMVRLRGAGPVEAAGVVDALELLAAFDDVFGCSTVPERCVVRYDDAGTGEAERTWLRSGTGERHEIEAAADSRQAAADNRGLDPTVPMKGRAVAEPRQAAADPRGSAADSRGTVQELVVRVETDAGPFARLSREDGADLIIRSALVPVPLRVTMDVDRKTARRRRKRAAADDAAAIRALTVVLRHVFRKREFRREPDRDEQRGERPTPGGDPPGGTPAGISGRPLSQADPILKLLDQQDCIALMPTGFGKSLIYQLAGMMMPGVTLVVDPTIALMKDQVEGLKADGFDRSTSVSSKTPRELVADLNVRIGRGEFQFLFLSPERLQTPGFRQTMRSLTNSAQVSLAVVDEAHCVSEWGHDYRPAYLHLADRLRELGRADADDPPPLVGLTGTASRAVLRDMLVELKVDTVLRPDSFDRAELEFDVRRVRGGSSTRSHKALEGVLSALPREFRMSGADFYAARGSSTTAGIVFVPHVNGKFGLSEVGDLVVGETRAKVALYGGSKREDGPFTENKASVMVATKAFGMGIDKENVHWTVHLGMPASIESFYQEAGRAGRTRQKALCTVVYSELDQSRNDDLLDPGIDFEEAKRRYKKTQGPEWWLQADDVTRALFFHFNAFEGSASDVDSAREVLRRAGDLTKSHRVELPMDEEKRKEKAVCVLRRVGVVREYDVEYRAKKIIAHFEPFDAERSRRRLAEYFVAADPARAGILQRKAEAVAASDNQAHALELARLLIEFTYDQVERGRRRMTREAMLLARNAQNDAEIRQRLLDYLSEGVGAANLEKLLEQPQVDFKAWWGFVEKINLPQEAGELRGMCIRALESWPEHPGLLLTRAVAEALCTDQDQAVSATGIVDAIRSGLEKYELGEQELEAAVHRIFEAAGNGRPPLAAPLTVALVRLGAAAGDVPGLSFAAALLERVDELGRPELNTLVRAEKLRRVAERVEAASGRLKGWLGPPEIAGILDGGSDGR